MRLTRSPLGAPREGETPTVRLNQGWVALTHDVWDTRVSAGPLARACCAAPAGGVTDRRPTVLTRAVMATASAQRAVLAQRIGTGKG